MDTKAIKGCLHEYIETADSEHLAAIYLLLQKDMGDTYTYDEETLAMLYKRVEDSSKGFKKSYTTEETFSFVREEYRKK